MTTTCAGRAPPNLPSKEDFLASLEPDPCPICYEGISEPIRVACGHNFCVRCAITWFEDHNTCPTCRKELYVGEVPEFYEDEGDGDEAVSGHVDADFGAREVEEMSAPLAGTTIAPSDEDMDSDMQPNHSTREAEEMNPRSVGSIIVTPTSEVLRARLDQRQMRRNRQATLPQRDMTNMNRFVDRLIDDDNTLDLLADMPHYIPTHRRGFGDWETAYMRATREMTPATPQAERRLYTPFPGNSRAYRVRDPTPFPDSEDDASPPLASLNVGMSPPYSPQQMSGGVERWRAPELAPVSDPSRHVDSTSRSQELESQRAFSETRITGSAPQPRRDATAGTGTTFETRCPCEICWSRRRGLR